MVEVENREKLFRHQKPYYHAYAFLHRLKGDIIAQGEGYIVADDGRTLRALLWNY